MVSDQRFASYSPFDRDGIPLTMQSVGKTRSAKQKVKAMKTAPVPTVAAVVAPAVPAKDGDVNGGVDDDTAAEGGQDAAGAVNDTNKRGPSNPNKKKN